MTERTPRYIVTCSEGGRYLLDADHRPIACRPARDAMVRLVDPGERLQGVIAERDLWPYGESPKSCAAAAWTVNDAMRRWGFA